MWFFFFFKQKTAYEIPLCDWSSDVCSSDLEALGGGPPAFKADRTALVRALRTARPDLSAGLATALADPLAEQPDDRPATAGRPAAPRAGPRARWRVQR